MSKLQEKLDEINRQKKTYIKPENLRQGITAFGVEGAMTTENMWQPIYSNQTFTDYYNNFIDPELEKNNEGSPINITSVDYSYSIHQNVLSIYLQDETNDDTNQYISCNISLDGESVTNNDLIKIAGFTQDEVIGSISNQLEDLTDEEYKEKTLAEDNCNINLPMWINDDGNLIVVVKIYSSNNAGYYYKDIIIGK